MLLDVESLSLGSLHIAKGSRLSFGGQVSEMGLAHLVVEGVLELGTPAQPFGGDLVFTLNGIPGYHDHNGMGTRGIFVLGGTLIVHGIPPENTWGRLTSPALGPDRVYGNQIKVVDGPRSSTVSWSVGDGLAISPTDYFSTGPNTTLVTEVQGGILGGPLQIMPVIRPADARWAKRQYLIGAGAQKPNFSFVEPVISLAQSLPAIPDDTPNCIDQRAYVGNLTRNIKIQAPEDDAWNLDGFGVHIMVMRMPGGPMPFAQVEGIEIRRAGQRNTLGRYPFHWHMLSYAPAVLPLGGDGLPLPACEAAAPFDNVNPDLGPAAGQYFRRNSIVESRNRGVVIHGTNGVEVSENVLYDIQGHGIFLEDGAERENMIERNLILKVRNTAAMGIGEDLVPALKAHESGPDHGSSGMWISNPDNDIVGNIVADTESAGVWMAFSYRAFGLSSQAKVVGPGNQLHPMRPFWMRLGDFRDNVSFSNKFEGFLLDLPEIEPCSGTTGSSLEGNALAEVQQSASILISSQPDDLQFTDYRPYSTDLIGGSPESFTISSCATWKNNLHGFWNRSEGIQLERIVSADNSGRYFAGDTLQGDISRSLVVQDTLNNDLSTNPAPRPQTHVEYYPCGFATYHSGADVHENIIAGFREPDPISQPDLAKVNSGAFATDDYYLIPLEKGHARNHSNHLVNCDPGRRLERLDVDYALAGALWDAQGHWSGQPDCDTYLVYDDPFFATVGTPQSGGLLVPGPYYGFNDFRINEPGIDFEDEHKIVVTRQPASTTSLALVSPVGTWTIEKDKGTAIHNVLSYLRHFVTHPTGHYILDFPEFGPNVGPWIFDVGMKVTGFLSTDDSQIIAVPFHGANVQRVYTSTSYDYFPDYAQKNLYQDAGTEAAFLAQYSGMEAYWHDTANDLVWVRVVGRGMPGTCAPADLYEATDEELYAEMGLRIDGQ